MDPALLKEREAFKRRALAQPSVENKKAKISDSAKKKDKSADRVWRTGKDTLNKLDYKNAAASSVHSTNFRNLGKIVNFMKERHKAGETHGLTIDDILDEANMLDISSRQKMWLVNEALANNPKIEVVQGDKYLYKPRFNIRDKKGLLKLLDRHDQKGLGGILYDEVEESLPHVEKAIRQLGDKIIIISRPDKKKVLYYNDKSYLFTVDEEFQKQWRSVAVDSMDETKIEEYLQKQGITFMQDLGNKKVQVQKRKKTANRRKGNFKKLNDHMGDVLQDYSQKT